MNSLSESIIGEGNLLLISIASGVLLMLGYDILRILRKLIKHGIILIALEDILYWILCGVGIFAMLYQENDGLLRWFVVAGVALGMLIENSWISPLIVRINVYILGKIGTIFGKVWKIYEKPGKKLFRILRKQLKKTTKAFKIGLSKF